jgi:hypothetical protein
MEFVLGRQDNDVPKGGSAQPEQRERRGSSSCYDRTLSVPTDSGSRRGPYSIPLAPPVARRLARTPLNQSCGMRGRSGALQLSRSRTPSRRGFAAQPRRTCTGRQLLTLLHTATPMLLAGQGSHRRGRSSRRVRPSPVDPVRIPSRHLPSPLCLRSQIGHAWLNGSSADNRRERGSGGFPSGQEGLSDAGDRRTGARERRTSTVPLPRPCYTHKRCGSS